MLGVDEPLFRFSVTFNFDSGIFPVFRQKNRKCCNTPERVKSHFEARQRTAPLISISTTVPQRHEDTHKGCSTCAHTLNIYVCVLYFKSTTVLHYCSGSTVFPNWKLVGHGFKSHYVLFSHHLLFFLTFLLGVECPQSASSSYWSVSERFNHTVWVRDSNPKAERQGL